MPWLEFRRAQSLRRVGLVGDELVETHLTYDELSRDDVELTICEPVMGVLKALRFRISNKQARYPLNSPITGNLSTSTWL